MQATSLFCLLKQQADFVKILSAKIEVVEKNYIVRLAQNRDEIDAVLRLRFEVFNLELGEGLEASYINERDEDKFDKTCHHLIVIERKTGEIVGTYRLQTLEMAGGINNFYSAEEFHLEDLPLQVLEESMEIGRACIARSHRNKRVLFLLWKGLANYLLAQGKRYLFGCCSLTSQNSADGWNALQILEEIDSLHPFIYVRPLEECRCETEIRPENKTELPTLFLTYLKIGARVCSPPAVDRSFKTIDFLVLFDLQSIQPRYRQLFFS